jgi:carboxymethylenebutenolidase
MGNAIELRRGDRRTQAYLTVPARGQGPGVLVLHAWWGLNPFFKATCDRLAGAGFVALAPDLYDGRIALSVDEAERMAETASSAEQLKHAEAAIEMLRRHPAVLGDAVGVVGFSLGASYGVELTRQREDVRAAVLFYGGSENEYPLNGHTAFLGHFAERDPYEPAERVRALQSELRATGKQATVHVYRGTGHWFFERDRPDAYDADAADLAWRRTVSFLHDELG